jgi:hypothetical protein
MLRESRIASKAIEERRSGGAVRCAEHATATQLLAFQYLKARARFTLRYGVTAEFQLVFQRPHYPLAPTKNAKSETVGSHDSDLEEPSEGCYT